MQEFQVEERQRGQGTKVFLVEETDKDKKTRLGVSWWKMNMHELPGRQGLERWVRGVCVYSKGQYSVCRVGQ